MMTNHDDSPVSARAASLAWHHDVRRALARGLGSIAAARAAAPGAVHSLRESAYGIAAVVRGQVAAEDLQLAPVLQRLDAWGPSRKARLDALHDREQAAVEHALEAEDDARMLAGHLGESIREIVRVLRLEEKELLDADLLDDTTTVPAGGPGQG
jgi:hypothetical protein